MSYLKWAKNKVKKLTIWDIGFIKLAMVSFGILLVYWIPKILSVNIWVWVTIFVLAIIKPVIKLFRK